MTKKQIKTLFVTRTWPPAIGGMERYSLELSNELKKIVECDVVALLGAKDGGRASLLRVALFFLSTCVFIIRNRRRYDVAHFADLSLFPIAYWHSLVSPEAVRIVSVHGLDLLFGHQLGILPTIYRQFLVWARRRDCADHFIANSRNTARICAESGFSPVTAVPLGVRLNEAHSLNDCHAPELPNERYLLFVGRVVKRKGVRWFAEQVLPALTSDVKLYVVGKIHDNDEAAALRRNPRIKVHEYVTDSVLDLLMTGATAIIMPNLPSEAQGDVEGFGLVAVESAAVGVPVVASRLEGIIDAIQDGVTGFLVEPADPCQWREVLQELLDWNDAERANFTKRAREVVREAYSWSRVASDTCAIYERALGNRERHLQSCSNRR